MSKGVARLLRESARALALFAIAAFIVPRAAWASKPQYEIAPAPRWVQPLTLEVTHSLPQNATGGSVSLLLDRQIRVQNGWSEYNRYVSRVVNAAGVEDASQLTIDFDPQLDHLVLHAVTLRRGTQVIDELAHGRIEVLQRESGLEQSVLDGSLTFHLLLTDVRAGDTIDESYTIEHRGPAWGNRFFEQLTTRWDDPIDRSRLRVLVPTHAPLYVAGSEPSAPVRTRTKGWQVLEWNWTALAAVAYDLDAPSWFQQHPAIQLSQFADWGEVVKAALPLYSFDTHDRGVSAAAENLKSGLETQEDRALAAIRFVQEKIRYTGLEFGSGAFRPRPPGEALRSRYGDCKDKALLAVALLRAMGIDAVPALVSTRWEGHLDGLLPSPGDFDHAIVRMRLADRTYWIDVTETAQGGTLETLDQSQLGEALVISPGITALEPIPHAPAAQPLTTATAVFDLRGGLDAEGSYTISTVYRGSDADDLRRKLQRTSAADLGKGYLNYYKGQYPEISAAGPPSIHDDPHANVITVDEAYRIPHPFGSVSSGEQRFELETELIHDYVQPPGQPARAAPLALDYPLYTDEQITVRLPSFFPVKDEAVTIDHPTFHYESRLTHKGNDVFFEARYKTLADSVPHDELDDFLKKREAARQDCSLSFTYDTSGPNEKASAAATDALAKALALSKAGHTADADAAFTKLLGSPDFDYLNAAQRHAVWLVAGATAYDKGDYSHALDLLQRACGTEQAAALDWKMRLYAAQRTADAVDAGYALTTVARRWPQELGAIDFRTAGRVLHNLPDAGTSRYELLSALHDAQYTDQNVDLSEWWRDLVLLQLERGEIDKARTTAAGITAPYALISMQADTRFVSIRQVLPDLSSDIRQRIQQMQATSAKHPDELAPVLQLTYLLLFSSRFDEALHMTDSAVATVRGPKGPKAYKDYDTQYGWILDARGEALVSLGRWDEAVAQLLEASHLPEAGGNNVSQTINLASLYDDLGRPRDAQAALSGLQADDMSPYGHMQATIERIAIADQLGDQAAIEHELAYASAHRADSERSYQQALISANRMDDAAHLLISRLQDPSERIDALMEVQGYSEFPLPSRAQEIRRRWRSLIERQDVRAAVAQVGTIGTYPVVREPM